MLLKDIGAIAFLVSGASGARQHFPRATVRNLNATTTSDLYPTIPTCCYLDSFGVDLILWWTSSVEVTVATVSTIVYQYDNTAVTSYRTIKANTTQSLPTGYFNNFGSITISGVPTNIIGNDLGGYEADTTLITGTEFTDPYGVVYTSPTPVWQFDEVTYYTLDPTTTGSAYGCPTPSFIGMGDGLSVYPSGYFIADNDTSYGQNNTGEIFKAGIPIGLKYWVEDHIPPNNSDDTYSQIGECTMGFGDGIPVAHIPVTELTAGVTTTTTLTGNLGGITTSTPLSTTPELETQSTTTPAGENSPTSMHSESTSPTNSIPTSVPSSVESSVAPGSTTGPGEVSITSPGADSSNTAGSPPNETNTSKGSGSGTTIGNVPGGSNFPSSVTNIVSGSSSSIVGAGSENSGSGTTTAVGNGNVRGSQTTATEASSGGFQTTGSSGKENIVTPQPSSTVAPIFTAGGSTFTGNSATGFLIGSSTLKPGGTVIISGSGTILPITYVLPTSGSAVIINGVTEALSSKTVAPATTTPILVVGSSTYTANSASEYVIGGQTLTAGGFITESGETLSLATGGQIVVVVSGTSTKTESLGGIIASVGGFATGTATPSYVTASKVGLSRVLNVWVLGIAFGMGLIGVLAL